MELCHLCQNVIDSDSPTSGSFLIPICEDCSEVESIVKGLIEFRDNNILGDNYPTIWGPHD